MTAIPASVAALLEIHQQWARWLTKWWVISFVIVGGLSAAALVGDVAGGHTPGVSLAIFALVSTFFGANLWLIRDNTRRVTAALDNPGDTIAIYAQGVTVNGVKRRSVDLVLCPRKGRRARLLVHREHANRAIAILQRHMPHATAGRRNAKQAKISVAV